MDIMNKDRNIFNLACVMFCYYNVISRLTFLLDGSRSIRYLKAKFLRMGQSHWTILLSKYMVITVEYVECVSDSG